MWSRVRPPPGSPAPFPERQASILFPSAAKTFLTVFLAVATGVAAVIYVAIQLLDPYGISPVRLPLTRAIMDINQRYMYPQIARRQEFNSVVIGTSTSRLLDPRQLDEAFGGTFANFAMNAGTAWEQAELAKLYLRHNPAPRSFILGIDEMWCLEGRNIPRTTFRGFPEWMYDENRWNDLPEVFNLKTLEIAGRQAAFHLGLMPERIRRDGYEVFTPPEETYDLARARFHIWRLRPSGKVEPIIPPRELSAAAREALVFQAIDWLDSLLARLPPETRRMLVYMPLHIAQQPIPGSREAAELNVCKTRIDTVAARHGAKVVDFAIPSAVTREDSNYWDPLHYRLPIAGRIIAGMKRALDTGRDDPGGDFVVRR
jgi:hypothetical protein